MAYILNNLGLPIGTALPGWVPPSHPPREPMIGQYCRVEPLDAERHTRDLYTANSADTEQRMWTYLPYGPFPDPDDYISWAQRVSQSDDPFFHAIVDLSTGHAVGVASYLRITPASGSIEVGHIAFSPSLQRTRAATEAMYLMMERIFTLGYRRYEWKCDALNARSRAAAKRLGFSFEGIFRQATVYRGRNRDTAWFAMIDQEWPALQRAFQQWLDPANFDANGCQRLRLADLTAAALQ